jgi:predicted transcriptional regulator
MSKGGPINIRLDDATDAALSALAPRAGVNQSELIRRAIKLAYRNYHATGDISGLTDPAKYESSAFAEQPTAYRTKKPPANKRAS